MERYYCPRCGTRLDIVLLHKIKNTAQICFSCNGCGSQWYRKIRERITEQEAESVERH